MTTLIFRGSSISALQLEGGLEDARRVIRQPEGLPDRPDHLTEGSIRAARRLDVRDEAVEPTVPGDAEERSQGVLHTGGVARLLELADLADAPVVDLHREDLDAARCRRLAFLDRPVRADHAQLAVLDRTHL